MRRAYYALSSIAMLIAFTIFWTAPLAQAAKVKAYKGKKVLVDMQEDIFKIGDILKIEDNSGESVGLIRVTKVKGRLAQGIYKGTVEKDFNVRIRPDSEKPKSKQTAKVDEAEEPEKSAKSKSTKKSTPPADHSGTHFGVMLGANYSSAEIKLLSEATVSLAGIGYSLKTFIDYPLLDWLQFRGMTGLEQFNVGGATNSVSAALGGCAGECTVEINYFTLDLWGRILFGGGKFRAWLGGGGDFMFPLTKSATALDEASIIPTNLIAVGGGFDIWLAGNHYIPIQIEYNMYPPSKSVKASAVAVRAGYSF